MGTAARRPLRPTSGAAATLLKTTTLRPMNPGDGAFETLPLLIALGLAASPRIA